MQFIFTPKHVKSPEEYVSALLNGYYDIHISDDCKNELFALLEARRNEHPMIMHSYAKALLHSSHTQWEYAFQLLVELARQKFIPAINTLAYCYRRGCGVERSLPRSNKCLKLAAEQGFVPTLFNIACNCPDYFKDVPREEAIETICAYLKQAEQQGFYPARIAVLRKLHEELKIAKQHWKDYSFLDLCTQLAKEGEYEAQFLLGEYLFGQRSTTISPEENATLEQSAATWQQKAAEAGFELAQMALAAHYYTGIGVPQSIEKAVEWWQKAADQHNDDALFNLGICYEKGIVFEQSFEKAFACYRDARLHRLATNNLAVCYLLGRGAKRSVEDAIDHFKDAIDGLEERFLEFHTEYGPAFYNLAQCYENGYGVVRSWPKALWLYKKAALTTLPEAVYRLATYYELGINVTQSHKKAERLLDQIRNDDPELNMFNQQEYDEMLIDVKKTSSGLHLSPISCHDFEKDHPWRVHFDFRSYCHRRGNRRFSFYL